MSSEIQEQESVSAEQGLSSAESASCNDLLYWRPIDDSAKKGKVLLSLVNSHGKRRTIIGFWVERFSIEDDSDYYELGDFDEKQEIYYWHEGWYENVESHDEFGCCKADGEVTHWMPLPKFAEAI